MYPSLTDFLKGLSWRDAGVQFRLARPYKWRPRHKGPFKAVWKFPYSTCLLLVLWYLDLDSYIMFSRYVRSKQSSFHLVLHETRKSYTFIRAYQSELFCYWKVVPARAFPLYSSLCWLGGMFKRSETSSLTVDTFSFSVTCASIK